VRSPRLFGILPQEWRKGSKGIPKWLEDESHYGGPHKSWGNLLLDGIFWGIVLFLIASFVNLHLDSLKAFWRRRKTAARYKRSKKTDVEASAAGLDNAELSGAEDDEPTFYETLTATFTSDKRAECVVDLGSGSKTHTIDAYVSTLEKVSELPFLLQENCKRSGVGELAALSLVDLWIHERAQIILTDASGKTLEVGRETTPSQVRRAKTFRVNILPPPTR
jgi:hypothetical protein